jgi:hypothetical protein
VTLLAIIKALLSFADGLMKYLNDGQLLDAGRHIQAAQNLQNAAKEAARADKAAEDMRTVLRNTPGILRSGEDFRP